jgi:uncharacterized protein YbcV (DUF1398 family)
MNVPILDECKNRSLAGTITFPEVVQQMAAAGVERYAVDLVRHETTYYDDKGDTHRSSHPMSEPPAIAVEFSPKAVREALHSIQSGAIQYPEFLRHIMAAGTVGYSVYIKGRKAIYCGRNGDMHVDPFP